MPRRVKPQWGNIGAVCVRGAGQTDDQLVERGVILGAQGRGDYGCMLSDAEFGRLAAHLKMITGGAILPVQVRARLHFIRDFYLKSRLYEAQTPAQRECNAALRVVSDRVEAFLTAVAALKPLPDWALATANPTEGPSPFRMFMAFPQRLRALASVASTSSENGTPAQSAGRNRAELFVSLSNGAMQLADALVLLDHASKDDILRCLPWTADYDMDSFTEVAGVSRKLGNAVRDVLAVGRKQGGPRPFRELLQTVAWLGDVYEACGGRFRHTPRLDSLYDGTPRSAAGRFIAEFFAMCDPDLRAPSISSALQQVIGTRN